MGGGGGGGRLIQSFGLVTRESRESRRRIERADNRRVRKHRVSRATRKQSRDVIGDLRSGGPPEKAPYPTKPGSSIGYFPPAQSHRGHVFQHCGNKDGTRIPLDGC